ncbi:MAG: A/G-specific adenine glycosylase [Rhizobiaceae bacterium]
MEPLNSKLLAWYDRHARTLPWRISPHDGKQGVVADPYHVWLSEVMLQQTTVATVKSYFEKFIHKWPRIEDLAASDAEDVMKAWAGLGYYSRARNLKACAELVAVQFDGNFPQTAEELQKLPGIGPYTAAAIAAIAFGRAEPVVDGNIERVSTRYTANATPLPAVKDDCRAFMTKVTPHDRPGDFVQAMMDLGATICTPRNPACALCPINEGCAARATNSAMDYPVKAPKKKKPTRVGAAYVLQRGDGSIWLTKRPSSGLLGGMSVVPTTDWTSRRDGETAASAAPVTENWKDCGIVRHTFTHFHLDLKVWHAETDKTEILMSGKGWWSAAQEIAGEALPTVMKKAISAAIRDAFKETA